MIFNPSFYRKAGWLTCFSIFLLVLAGGIVRTTGSGMGCPDWPTCFGTYIPPTNVNQLPENYQEVFLEKRLAKIDKYVNVLNSLGFTKQAEKIKNDPEIKKAHPFSVVTTWIEALNRYLGALTGVFALAAFISAFQYFRKKPFVFALTFLGIIAILINAWMGSVVVATNLMQGPITVHYLAAFLAVALFMWPLVKLQKDDNQALDNFQVQKQWILVAFTLVLVQSVTGTWSRETIDLIASQGSLVDGDGHLNLSAMGFLFVIHRYLAIPVLGIAIVLWIKQGDKYHKYYKWISIIIISQVLAGSANILWVLPPIAQAYHIFAGGVIFGLWLYLLLQFFVNKYHAS